MNKETGIRDDKHINLDKAINELWSIHRGLIRIISQITGPISEIEIDEDMKTLEPSLSDVLEQGPDRIRSYIAEMYSLLQQPDNVLF